MDSVKIWLQRIEAAKKFQEEVGNSKKWDTWKDYYLGVFGAKHYLNLSFAICRSLIPQLYLKNPSISVTPTKPGFEMTAMILEREDQEMIKKSRLKQLFRRVIMDAMIYGTCPIVLGYDKEVSEKGVLSDYSQAKQLGFPWAVRNSPYDFLVPYGTMYLEEARWCAQRIVKTKEDFKDCGRYKDSMLDKLKTKYIVGNKQKDNPGPSEDQLYEIWEVYDRKEETVYGISEGVDKFLLEEELQLPFDGFAFEALVFNENPNGFWGMSDIGILEPQQLELIEAHILDVKHRRLSTLKFLYEKGTIVPDELAKLTSADVGAGAETTGNPASAILPLRMEMPLDFIKAKSEIRSDARELIGYSRNQMGEYAETGRTATEAMVVSRSSELRTDERQDIVSDVFVSILEKFNKMIFELWDEERVIDVLGPDSAKYWVTYTGQELRSEYNVSLDITTQTPTTKEAKVNEALRLLELFRGDSDINQQELKKRLLRELRGTDSLNLLVQSQAGVNPAMPVPLDKLKQLSQMMSEKGMMPPGGVPQGGMP